MKRIILLIALPILCTTNPVIAQATQTLDSLSSGTFRTFYSKGHTVRATEIAARIERAISFHQKSLNFAPAITLMVLDTTDWKTHSTKGAVYGMPHYSNDGKGLIVAAEDNPFWKSFLPPVDKLPADLRKPFIVTYGNKDGQLSAQPFFDLLAIHELGHAFHIQGGLKMQRNWMGELFCNIFLHTYIAEKEPALLPALTLFPKLVVSSGAKDFKYTSLNDLQENYNEIAMKYPRNYGWYQCSWHVAAGKIYDQTGEKSCTQLWKLFKDQQQHLDEGNLLTLLKSSGNNGVADMIQDWDKNIIL